MAVFNAKQVRQYHNLTGFNARHVFILVFSLFLFFFLFLCFVLFFLCFCQEQKYDFLEYDFNYQNNNNSDCSVCAKIFLKLNVQPIPYGCHAVALAPIFA